ncbi:response regulator [Candidatus Obscuribacterales bacterium]|nr:response regulator [Candidatus Obscuribacterales bacterium]
MDKPRILITIDPDELSNLKQILNPLYDLQFAYSHFEAKRRLTYEKLHQELDLIIVTVPFSSAEPLEFLQLVRGQEVFDSVPVLVLLLHDVGNESRDDLKMRADNLGVSGFLCLTPEDGQIDENELRQEISNCLVNPKVYSRHEQESVLIADGDPYVRNLARQFLTEAGYSVSLVSDGYEALDLARKEVPKLVLADMLLPRLDGLALCKLLKTDPTTSHIITVIVTSVLSAEERARAAGADAFLRKPIEKGRVLAMLKETVGALRKEKEHASRDGK